MSEGHVPRREDTETMQQLARQTIVAVVIGALLAIVAFIVAFVVAIQICPRSDPKGPR
jgi:hypothetical protein